MEAARRHTAAQEAIAAASQYDPNNYYYGYQPGQPWPETNLGQKPKLGGVRISHRHYIYVHTHSLLDVSVHTFSLYNPC